MIGKKQMQLVSLATILEKRKGYAQNKKIFVIEKLNAVDLSFVPGVFRINDIFGSVKFTFF